MAHSATIAALAGLFLLVLADTVRTRRTLALSPGGTHPRVTPTGTETAPTRTGGTDKNAWIRSRYASLVSALPGFGVPLARVSAVAKALLAHWALETGTGRAEWGWNFGNIRAFARTTAPWHRLSDGLPYLDFQSLDAGVRAYLGLASRAQYAPAWRALVAGSTALEWMRSICSLGARSWHPWHEPGSTNDYLGRLRAVETVLGT